MKLLVDIGLFQSMKPLSSCDCSSAEKDGFPSCTGTVEQGAFYIQKFECLIVYGGAGPFRKLCLVSTREGLLSGV